MRGPASRTTMSAVHWCVRPRHGTALWLGRVRCVVRASGATACMGSCSACSALHAVNQVANQHALLATPTDLIMSTLAAWPKNTNLPPVLLIAVLAAACCWCNTFCMQVSARGCATTELVGYCLPPSFSGACSGPHHTGSGIRHNSSLEYNTHCMPVQAEGGMPHVADCNLCYDCILGADMPPGGLPRVAPGQLAPASKHRNGLTTGLHEESLAAAKPKAMQPNW